MNRIKILYVSSKRAEERQPLSAIQDLDYCEVPLHASSQGVWGIFCGVLKIQILVKSLQPKAILFENCGFLSAIIALSASFWKIPIIVRMKGDPWTESEDSGDGISFSQRIRKRLNYFGGQFVLRHATLILTISDALQKVVQMRINEHKHCHTVFISKQFETWNDSMREDPNLPKKFILTVTNFNYWGKVSTLLDAIDSVVPYLNQFGIKWIILGNGFYWNNFKFQLDRHTRFKEVYLLGHRSPELYYRNALALFHISGMDGLPNVIIEAFYYSLPVVMNNDCPAIEFIISNHNGIVLDFNNKVEIESLFDLIVNNPELLSDYKQRALDYAKQQFSINAVSEQLREGIWRVVHA